MHASIGLQPHLESNDRPKVIIDVLVLEKFFWCIDGSSGESPVWP